MKHANPYLSVRDTAEEGFHSGAGVTISRARRWTGLFLSGFGVLFIVFDASVKLLRLPQAVAGMTAVGFQESTLVPIGVLQIILLALYLIPRTAPLGVILWTGYLGGAIAAHVRLASPLFSHVLFPVYIAAFLWAGLWLRDRRVAALLKPERSLPGRDRGRREAGQTRWNEGKGTGQPSFFSNQW